MLKEPLQYWEDLYSKEPLEKFLEEVKDYFVSDNIKLVALKLRHRLTQLDEQVNKGVISNKDYTQFQAEISSSAFKIYERINEEYLPILPVKAIAGMDLGPQYAVEFYEVEEWRKVPRVKTRDRLGIRVEGKSMEPKYFENDVLVCKKVNINEVSSRQSVVVVLNDDSIFLKRIKKKDRNLELISINKEYEPFEISLSEVGELWLVERKIK